MTVETSQLLNAFKRNSVRWAIQMINLSIALAELGCVAKDPHIAEACMVKAKRAYGTALTKGKRSFTAKECSDFEFKSFRAETLIAELDLRLANQRNARAMDEPLDESLAS
jgi:hypothetical protein